MIAYSALSEFYDSLTTDVPYTEIADFAELVFAEYGVRVKSILDIACGTGTFMSIMARRGYDITAADPSAEMLSVASGKLEGLEPKPLLLCQSAEELDLYGTVDAAVCTLDGLNYIAPDSLGEALRRVLLFLEPGGVFLFDINTPYKLRSLDGEMFIDETDDVYCVWRTEFSEEDGACIYGMDIFSRSGDVWLRSEEEHVEYAYEPERLRELLEQTGFEDVRLYGNLSLQPPAEDELRVFIAARKRLD